jgi:hypothetical protein
LNANFYFLAVDALIIHDLIETGISPHTENVQVVVKKNILFYTWQRSAHKNNSCLGCGETGMNERRKFERCHLIHYLRIYNQENGWFMGNLVDISSQGIKMISEDPLEPGKTYSFRMEFPEHLGGKNQLEFNALCKWRQTDINPAMFASGFELLGTSKEDLEIMNQLIEWYRD